MLSPNRAASFMTSPGVGGRCEAGPRRLIDLAGAYWRRAIRAIKEHGAGRDRVRPRNYSCWIRAP